MKYETDVCIVGAGPAGMVLGLLLAKLGHSVIVLEHHEDFSREYRGEVLMPRFTQMFRQIGLFNFIESYHHLKLSELEGFFHNRKIFSLNFKEISPDAPFSIWMPQPILLGALYDKAKTFPNFKLIFGARADSLIQSGGVTRGVQAIKDHEPLEINAKITVGTDGRFSVVRKRGGFDLAYENHDFDILWFTVPKPEDYDNKVRFFLSRERNYLILPKYPNSLQCGLILGKDEFHSLHAQGIETIRKILLGSQPLFRRFAEELKDFSPFSLLQAKIEMVREWAKDGLLLVGDSAHTCSPAGAIGVSVAVSSAIVGAEVISDALKKGDYSKAALGRLQELQESEVRWIHARQRNFTQILLSRSGFAKSFLPFLFLILAKTGVLRFFQRGLLTMKKPLAVSDDLKFRPVTV